MMVFNNFGSQKLPPTIVNYSKFILDIKQGQIKEVVIDGRTINGITNQGSIFVTYNPGDKGLITDLLNNNVKVISKPPDQQSLLMQIFISWFPMLLLFGLLIFFMRQMQGGGRGGALAFGKNKA
ncbi:MAG: ATP-dependent metallopeptidase FtsH/Yme1/Tma family protein, partial [Proteobacteria bacterium]|nr:ATP-dependent metallopeptidase FtsH/Yme1/Tma family protein [Pseudomonadota bacterium]